MRVRITTKSGRVYEYEYVSLFSHDGLLDIFAKVFPDKKVATIAEDTIEAIEYIEED